MKKRLLCFLLAALMVLGMAAVSPVQARAESLMTTSDALVDLLKEFEGFSKYPYWDYSQWTVGYGTRCPEDQLERYTNEGITEEEAEALLREHIAIAESAVNRFIDKFSLTVNQGQFDCMICFSFNCGTSWLNKSGTLRNAIIEGKTGNDFLYAMCLWCWAGNKIQPGLLERRLIEANIYLNGIYSSEVPENYCYVLFDPNGGDCDIRVQGYDSTTGVAPVAVATYENMMFAGWYSTREGGTQITALDAAANGRTLYARWAEDGEIVDPSDPTDPTDPGDPTDPSEPSDPTDPPAENTGVEVKVTGDVVNVRAGAGTGYAVVTSVKRGETIVITEVAEGSGYTWGKFTKGWIALKYTNYDEVTAGEEEEPEDKVIATGTVYNAPSRLRVRSEANTSSAIVAYLSNGTQVELYEYKTVGDTRWGRINKGWVSMDYILLDSVDVEEPDVPPVTDPEPTDPEPTDPEPTDPEPTDPEPTDPEPTDPEPSEPEEPATMMGTIVDAPNGLRVRSQPATGSTVTYLYNGNRVEILETTTVNGAQWGRIVKGWISMDYVKLDSSNEGGSDEKPGDEVIATGTITGITSYLNIRSKAGTSGAVVGQLRNGEKVEIYEKTTVSGVVWGRIAKGWISLDYVKLDSTGSDNDNIDTVIDTGTVAGTSVLRVRSGAGTGYSVVGTLNKGDRVEIYETKSVGGAKWGRISNGWICLDYVELDSADSNESAEHTVTATTLRVRSGAGTGYSVVGYLSRGTKITVLETKTVNGTVWGRISTGWICMDYVD